MKKETVKTVRAFAIELVIYAVLVIGYFFLVLHLLGQWLYELEIHHRYLYAGRRDFADRRSGRSP